MRFKSRYVLIAAILLLSLLSGCAKAKDDNKGAVEQSVYEKIQRVLVNLETYQSNATVEYISNKSTNIYETIQSCKITGEYRVEVVGPDTVTGAITLSDGKNIYQFNPKVSGKIAVGTKETRERSEIFVTSFIRNYAKSQEVSVAAATIGNAKATVLEATIPGEHPYLRTEKLWVDNKTYKPVKLVVYDPEGSERIIVTFKTFDYNIELSDDLFKI